MFTSATLRCKPMRSITYSTVSELWSAAYLRRSEERNDRSVLCANETPIRYKIRNATIQIRYSVNVAKKADLRPAFIPHIFKRYGKKCVRCKNFKCALTGNRTQIYCLEGSNANHYTINARRRPMFNNRECTMCDHWSHSRLDRAMILSKWSRKRCTLW